MDNSKRTDSAVDCALDLGRRFDTRVDVVHAVNLEKPHWWSGDDGKWAHTQAEVMSQARRAVGRRLDQLIDDSGRAGLRADDLLHVVPGRPSQALRRFAANQHAAMIVLGGHRDHGLFDFGCTMREMVGDAPCPVWVQTQPLEKVQRILVPVDLSPTTVGVLEVARKLAVGFGARAHILNCFEPPFFAYDPEDQPSYVVEDFCAQQRLAFERLTASPVLSGMPHTTEFVEGEIGTVVLQRAADVDLIVMGTHGHSAMAQLMLGSQAYRVLREARQPVVVVPQEQIGRLARSGG
jgi:nucleotide-binding universal stress UspA family protein